MSTFGPSNVFIGAAIYCVERKKGKKILKKNKGVKKWKRKKEKKEK